MKTYEEINRRIESGKAVVLTRKADIVGRVSYSDLKSGKVELNGKTVATGSMSSYSKALKISELLKEEIKKGV